MSVKSRKATSEKIIPAGQDCDSELGNLFACIKDYVFVLDRLGTYLKSSPNHPETIGKIGQSLQDDFDKPTAERFLETIQAVLSAQKSQQIEYCLLIKTKEIWFSTLISPLSEKTVLCIAHDISDRKCDQVVLKPSKSGLKTSESLLDAMFMQSAVGIAITDIDGRFIKTNPCYQQMVGYSETELASMRFTDITLTEDIEENLRLRDLVLRGECESYQMEKRFIHRDGRIVWGKATSSKISGDQGESPFFIGVLEDISDRKQAEESLQSLVEGTTTQTGENFLPALTEHIANTLKVRYVFITKPRENNLELSIAWMDGQLQPPSIVPLISSPCTVTVAEGLFCCADNLQQNFTKSEVIKSLNADSYLGVAIADSNGKKVASLCILDDKPITEVQRAKAILRVFAARVGAEIERREAVDALYQLNQQLEMRVEQRTRELRFANQQLILTNTELARATKLKDEFLANMSHELRTPLNAILGMSEGLMEGVFGDVNERQQRSLSMIETSGKHLLELINDILDVAKIGAGKLELEIHPVAIEEFCKSSLNFVSQVATKKNIHLEMSIQTNLGTIAIDERRLRQALINLLSNAVKFTPKGGRICLGVKLKKAQDTKLPATKEFPYALIFSIIDTGIGIAPENISQLFQTFVQIDSSLSRQYMGTGLGLTLVKQITELHGGCVSVSSQVGEGSCFSIILPHTGEIKLKDRVSSPNRKSSTVSDFENLLNNKSEGDELINPLILLAEDNADNVELFTEYLTNRKYSLIFAVNGQEAINIAIAQVPDLILMDIQMPVLDGLEAIKQIRVNPKGKHIPIVALTALAMPSDRQKCLQAGANEYLAKPVNLSHLETVIKQQLQLKSMK